MYNFDYTRDRNIIGIQCFLDNLHFFRVFQLQRVEIFNRFSGLREIDNLSHFC